MVIVGRAIIVQHQQDLILQDMFTPTLETEVWPRTRESEDEGSVATL